MLLKTTRKDEITREMNIDIEHEKVRTQPRGPKVGRWSPRNRKRRKGEDSATGTEQEQPGKWEWVQEIGQSGV